MPMLILEWEHIDQELEVVDSWLTHHLNLIVDLKTCQILKHLRQTVETGLHTVALLIVSYSRLAANLYREVDALLKTGHELVTHTELHILVNTRGHIDTDTGGTCSNRNVEILENTVILHPLGNLTHNLCMSKIHCQYSGYC